MRKVEEESIPVELVGMGQNQQAVFVVGFASVNDNDQNAFLIYVPGQIGFTVDLEGARVEYGDPREASPQN